MKKYIKTNSEFGIDEYYQPLVDAILYLYEGHAEDYVDAGEAIPDIEEMENRVFTSLVYTNLVWDRLPKSVVYKLQQDPKWAKSFVHHVLHFYV